MTTPRESSGTVRFDGPVGEWQGRRHPDRPARANSPVVPLPPAVFDHGVKFGSGGPRLSKEAATRRTGGPPQVRQGLKGRGRRPGGGSATGTLAVGTARTLSYRAGVKLQEGAGASLPRHGRHRPIRRRSGPRFGRVVHAGGPTRRSAALPSTEWAFVRIATFAKSIASAAGSAAIFPLRPQPGGCLIRRLCRSL
jgi:hypothetical protein